MRREFLHTSHLSLSLFVGVIAVFSIPHVVNAQIVINEVFPNPSGESGEPTEFIELYNLSDEAVEITGYRLKEAKEYIISEASVPPHGFVSFDRATTSLALNNSGDTIALIDTEGREVDVFVFDKTTEDYSWSRYPDGIGEFYLVSTVTPNEVNTPPPTPSPTPSLTPTVVPTSKPTVSPTSHPSETVTVTPTKKETLEQTVVPTRGSVHSSSSEAVLGQTFDENDAKSESHEMNEDLDSSVVTDTSESESENRYGPYFIMIGGVFFIVAGYVYFRKNRQGY